MNIKTSPSMRNNSYTFIVIFFLQIVLKHFRLMIMTALVNSRHGLGLDVMCLKDAYSLELFNVTCSLKLFHNVRALGEV